MRDALSIVFRREHLRKTARIALVVGCVLTLINQLDVFLGDKATAITFVKTGLNFCVPFIVSNLGLLAGKRTEKAAGVPSGRAESGILWNPEVGNAPPTAELDH
jgi:hypothetical protein